MLATKIFHQPLAWVKPELDKTIRNARNLLESLADQLENTQLINELNQEFYLLKGSLEILDFNGAALLLEDMQKACQALKNNTSKNPEETYEAVLEATLLLESYIDKLQIDQTDIPLTLLPVINDIRAAIEEPLLSESALFLPNLSIVPKTPDDDSNDEIKEKRLQESAKSLRPYYQAALLSWYRNPADKLSIQQMKLVARNLESMCYSPRNRQIWWILGGLFEALSDKGLKSNIAIRLLLGQSDRIIKALANNELNYYEKSPPFNLLKNTLYYISRASSEGDRVTMLKKVYQLDKVMPSDKDLSELRKQLKGPNSETLQAISKELKKILTQSKATLDNFTRNSPENTERLLQTIIPLKHVADTLSILSLSKEKQLLQEQIIRISKIIESKTRPNKEIMMDIASAIIQIDSGLHYIGSPFKKSQDKSSLTLEEESKMSIEKSKTPGKLPDTEYRYLATKAVLEAKDNITQVKNAILSFITAGQNDNNILQHVPELLTQVKACMQILNNTYASDIINGLLNCINHDLIEMPASEISIDFDLLAECLVGIDYYLEALSEERSSTEQILNMARDSLEKLGYNVNAPKRESKIPTLEAVVTYISEAPTRIKVNASSLSELEKNNISKKFETPLSLEQDETGESVVEYSPELPDEEVAEIFIEEALEELDNMKVQLSNLKLDISDKDTLSQIHRVYHTLKGSGKIAGAIHISDFSSTIEEFLNRVLFDAIQIDDKGVQLLIDAHELLMHLVECFRIRVAPPKEYNTLTEAAISLMAPKNNTSVVKESPSSKPETPKLIEESIPTQTPFLSAPKIESLLKDSFLQLAIMNHYINEKNKKHTLAPIPAYVVESINQLHSCAQRTDVKEFVQTTELLTKYIGNLAKKNTPVNSETVDILSEFCATTNEILLELPEMLGAPTIDAEEFSHVEIEIPAIKEIEEASEDSSNVELTDLLEEMYTKDTATSGESEIQIEPQIEHPIASIENILEHNISEDDSKPIEQSIEIESASDSDENDEDIDLIDIFIEEAEELLSKGNTLINDSDFSQSNNNIIGSVQRLLHTMKGSARMAGATSVANIAHAFESVAEAVSTRQIEYPSNFGQIFQNTLDAINDMIDDIKNGNDIRLHEELLNTINNLLNPEVITPSEEEHEPDISEVPSAEFEEIKIEKEVTSDYEQPSIIPSEVIPLYPHTETTSADAEKSAEILEADKAEQIESIPEPEILEPDEISESIETEQAASSSEFISETPIEPKEVAISHEESITPKSEQTIKKSEPLRVNSDLIDTIVNLANSEGSINNRLEDHVATIKTNLLELDKAISRALGQMRDLQFNTSRTQELSQQLPQDSELNLSQFSESQKIALRMMESIGDIENLHSVITKTTLETDNLISQQKKAHAQMYENLLSTRLVSFSIQSQRMQRIVRQTCQSLNKQAQLNLEGTDGFIDRVLLESIMSPIEHIIRNAIAHGIENAESRISAGKLETGQVSIRFRKQDSEYVIEVQDDGAGINPEIIKQKALEKGLIKSTQNLTDEDAIQLIFLPGFSTSSTVDQISGRGVGMNVVLTEIEALGGKVTINSTVGKGSVFTIRLPFTVSRNKTLLVRSVNNVYAIPTNPVLQTIPVSQAKLEALYSETTPVYEFEEQDYPLWHLESLLNKDAVTLPNRYQNAYLLILKHQHKRLALQVDGIIETRETLLKSAGPQLANIKGLAGTTILNDGKVALILDIPSLFSLADERTNTPSQIIYPVEEPKENDVLSALIVDDSITVRKVTERFLNRNSITTKAARDGIEALELLKNYKPDVLLLDIEMPNMDGLELARRIKASENISSIPIIMITSRTGQQHRQAASEIGVDVFLGKPYQENELLGYIQALTGKRIKHV